jgi:hypothetical protein
VHVAVRRLSFVLVARMIPELGAADACIVEYMSISSTSKRIKLNTSVWVGMDRTCILKKEILKYVPVHHDLSSSTKKKNEGTMGAFCGRVDSRSAHISRDIFGKTRYLYYC